MTKKKKRRRRKLVTQGGNATPTPCGTHRLGISGVSLGAPEERNASRWFAVFTPSRDALVCALCFRELIILQVTLLKKDTLHLKLECYSARWYSLIQERFVDYVLHVKASCLTL